MRKIINVKFDYGTEVVLKTDPGIIRVVSGYLLRQGSIQYGLAKGEEETWHQELELMGVKNFIVHGFKG
jgi:hypothetical protein